MRRRDCVRDQDTTLVCPRRHRQITMKSAYSNAERDRAAKESKK